MGLYRAIIKKEKKRKKKKRRKRGEKREEEKRRKDLEIQNQPLCLLSFALCHQ